VDSRLKISGMTERVEDLGNDGKSNGERKIQEEKLEKL